MGRYNNKKTQAAAEAAKHTPSRARFSKVPPKKNKGKPKCTDNNDNGNSNNSDQKRQQQQQQQQRKRQPNASTAARVIGKIKTRVGQQSTPTSTSGTATATTAQALKFADKSKFDELKLPEHIVENITTLLENLGVKESSNGSSNKTEDENTMTDGDTATLSFLDEEGNEIGGAEEDDDFTQGMVERVIPKRGGGLTGGTYAEYEDDVDEQDFDGPGRATFASPDAEGEDAEDESESESEIEDAEDEDSDDKKNSITKEDTFDELQENPTFLHLTQRLSFSEQNAARACRAIEDWDVGTDADNNNNNNTEKESKNKNNDESISLAMDWLCLHLTEIELTNGFRPNPEPQKMKASPLMSKSGVPLVGNGSIRAIPHPSISVAKSITTDKVWAKSMRLQGRVLGFVRLGFHHSEASQACEESQDYEKTPKPEDDAALVRLLSMLEENATDQDGSNPHEPLNATDLEYAEEERQNEREALEAIYDNQFRVETPSTGGGLLRYSLDITPAENLKQPARSKDCQLQVFLRPGYPVVETPLLLFTNPSLAPSLLRRINEEVTKKAKESIGEPVVFEVATFLSESLPEMQQNFSKEQRHKEFEAEQLRLRKQGGHDVSERVIDKDAKLGRRQRAKVKAAQKAYNRPDQMQKEEEERAQLQEGRMQCVKKDNSRIRCVRAEQVISKREESRIEEQAELAARAAMNSAFNRGESVDDARLAAKNARNDSLRENGVDVPPSDGKKETDKGVSVPGDNVALVAKSTTEQVQTTAKDEALIEELSSTEKTASNDFATTTPTTTAFMDRLRQMYDDAAAQKSGKGDTTPRDGLEGYHLTAPEGETIDENTEKVRMPRPVAVPTGELGEVMNGIILQQKEQPWLVSPEARVPSTIEKAGVSPEEERRQKQISKKLREDLARKRNSAQQWAQKNPNAQPRRGNKNLGFTPERFHSMMTVRRGLPAYKMEESIVNTIVANQITVIAGDTGCGKTTQVPQLVLDDLISKGNGANTNIIVTQPRRISAIGVSERISEERCEKVGDTCGYSIKLEKRTSSRTRLLLCTTGILLRRLQCDPDLASVSHIFVDEVHERDLNTDFLIIILKDLLARRKDLRLVLMSATLNSEAFSSYFGGCPVVSIPGRAHPVEENRLEDIFELTGYEVQEGSNFALKTNHSKPPKMSKSDLRKLYHPKYSKETIHSLSIVNEAIINYEMLAELLLYISVNQDEGAILVFMPGMMEITKTIEEMYKKEYFQGNEVKIYPLHSSLSTAEQTAIFELPPEGVRKIVVSTNIAETSITIEDVVYVVDAGRVKENRRDEVNETPTLVECWVSRASAKQRRGRAGRVRPGIAYHLYSSHTHDNELQDYQLPEMLRVGIEDLVLQILILDLGEPTSFLGKALNPPSEIAMSNSLKLLETLGAVECRWQAARMRKAGEDKDTTCGNLNVTSELTALGFHLATLPVNPRVGKMMIYGSLFGCVDPALTVAASMSARSPFISPFDQRDAADAARKQFAIEGSDHLTILNAFNQWKDMRQKNGNKAMSSFLKENFLGRLTLFQMEDLRKQFSRLLQDIGFLPKKFQLKDLKNVENANSANTGLVKAVLCAGLYPNIIVAPRSLVTTSTAKSDKKKAGECAFRSHHKGEVYLHPSTISFNEPKLDSRYCCYHDMVKTSKTYVRDCTAVSPFALLLFGGALEVYQTHGICSVDGWLKFRIDAKPATLVKYLRGQMERILLKKIVSPEEDVAGSDEGKALIQSISILFERDAQEFINIPDRSGGEIVRPWTTRSSDQAGSANNQNRDNGERGRSGRGGRGRGRGGDGSGTGRGGR